VNADDVGRLKRWHPYDYDAGRRVAVGARTTPDIARGHMEGAWDRGDFEGAAYWAGCLAWLQNTSTPPRRSEGAT
jgi:hypothetical protein